MIYIYIPGPREQVFMHHPDKDLRMRATLYLSSPGKMSQTEELGDRVVNMVEGWRGSAYNLVLDNEG